MDLYFKKVHQIQRSKKQNDNVSNKSEILCNRVNLRCYYKLFLDICAFLDARR